MNALLTEMCTPAEYIWNLKKCQNEQVKKKHGLPQKYHHHQSQISCFFNGSWNEGSKTITNKAPCWEF